MKLNEHGNKLESNIQVESQNFGIGDSSVVIEILRNRLYKHKVRTLVQEYLCNARDAHREIDNAAPIQVTIPNALSPVFKVRDFGPGISPERMRDVFVMYGASTKRTSNKQTGGFGIGAKSAWSYTDSFNVVTYIDGVKRTYVAHTGVNNNGRLDLIETSETDEPNGTEIQVAVKSQDLIEFRDSIFRATYFWTLKPIFKGVVDLGKFWERKSTKIGQHVEIVESLPSYLETSYSQLKLFLVIDGVAYNVSSSIFDKCRASLKNLYEKVNGNLVIYIGNGVVEVSASREELTDSPATLSGLEKLATQLLREVEKWEESHYSKVNSISTMLQTYFELSKTLRNPKVDTWGSYMIDYRSIRSSDLQCVNFERATLMGTDSVKRKERVPSDNIPIEDYRNKAIYFQSAPESKVLTNRRLRTLLNSNGKSVLLISKRADDSKNVFAQVIQDLNAIDLNTIQPTKAPARAKVQKINSEIWICTHIPDVGRQYTESRMLDQMTGNYIYTEMSEGSFPRNRTSLFDLREYLKREHGVELMGLSSLVVNKVSKLANFTSFEDFLTNFKPSKRDLQCVKAALSSNREEMLTVKGGAKSKCKFFAKMQEEYDTFGHDAPELLVNRLKDHAEVKTFVVDDLKLTNEIKSKYPLLKTFDRYSWKKEHAAEWIAYVNAKR